MVVGSMAEIGPKNLPNEKSRSAPRDSPARRKISGIEIQSVVSEVFCNCRTVET
jgi:hypothetical protein